MTEKDLGRLGSSPMASAPDVTEPVAEHTLVWTDEQTSSAWWLHATSTGPCWWLTLES